MTMPEAMKEAIHSSLQRGDTMQIQNPTHPLAIYDMTNAYDTHTRPFWLESKGDTVSDSHVWTGENDICIDYQKCALQMKKTKESVVYTSTIPLYNKKIIYVLLINVLVWKETTRERESIQWQ